MDLMFNREWTNSEIQTVKSLIARHNTNNSYANNMNKKHTGIVSELQAMFPLKEKHQVTNLYFELMLEMVQTMQNGNQHVAASNNLMNHNFGMTVELEDLAIGNMEVQYGSLVKDMGSMRKGEEVPHTQPTPWREMQCTGRSWTKDEHRKFLYGLKVYGRGKWKNISKHFIPSKTPIQICSHAQGYFKRLENPTKKQRYSINDVSLFDTEPLVQNNTSYLEGLAFPGSAYNSSLYGSSSQPAAMNNLAQVTLPLQHSMGQASCNHATSGQQQKMGASSFFASPMMAGDGSHTAWTSDQHDNFFYDPWIKNMKMN
ncbi:unnamed protein product [Urochloa decumbens]|uniref:Uncharacterized protein n=1 Tax=Urochloa decumbens TaxID=240449 RepID=A0ABC9DSQ2_9POAL